MQVDNLMVADGASAYYTSVARNVLEDFMSDLRASSSTQEIIIEPGIALRYEFDFYGLLTELKIPANLHWITMRVNKYNSPMEYQRKNGSVDGMVSILLPNEAELNRIIQAQGATTRLST